MTGTMTAVATEPSYCVRPVNVVPAKESAELALKFGSNQPLPIAPDFFGEPAGAQFPLMYHSYIVKRPDGLNTNHSLFWSFSASDELVGPRDFERVHSPIAVGRLGTSLAIGSIDERLKSAISWSHSLLLRQLDDGAFGEVDPALQARIAEPNLVTWSDILDGFVVFSTEWQAPTSWGRKGRNRSFVVKGDRAISLLDDVALSVAADLPSLGVTGLLGSDSLVLVTPQLDATEVTKVDRGRGFLRALYDTRDPGWIYVASDHSGKADYALHLEQSDGKWRATDIVRIAMNDGRLGNVTRWLLGEPSADRDRDGVSKIAHAGWCRKFSTSVKRMIFCEEMSEMRDGKLVPIGGGKVGLKEFIGDASSVGLALFIGTDGCLYGYDGDVLRPISNTTVGTARVRDLPRLRRTLLSTPSSLFELRRIAGEIELVKLTAPSSAGFYYSDFLAAPDGAAVFAFSHDGIYRLGDETFTLVWPSADPIDTSGGLPPTEINGRRPSSSPPSATLAESRRSFISSARVPCGRSSLEQSHAISAIGTSRKCHLRRAKAAYGSPKRTLASRRSPSTLRQAQGSGSLAKG